MGKKRAIWTHILMVVAPLLMIFALTMAWFINSPTTTVAPLSFASSDTGPGAALHKATLVENHVYDSASTPHTVTNTVTWGKEELPEHSDITITNMLPGQCAYYLLRSNGDFSVSLRNVTWFDRTDAEATSGADIPLAQCIGLYLVPMADLDLTDGLPPAKIPVTCALPREGNALTGQLSAAYFKGEAYTATLPSAGGDPAARSSTYALVVYCDPIYQQGPLDAQVGKLDGALSFSLTFTVEEAKSNG